MPCNNNIRVSIDICHNNGLYRLMLISTYQISNILLKEIEKYLMYAIMSHNIARKRNIMRKRNIGGKKPKFARKYTLLEFKKIEVKQK